MVIDHIGAIFFPEASILRLIGRISFPLFVFLMVDAFEYVKNDKNKLKKYALNLLIFAIISEVPYDLLFKDKVCYFFSQNVLFALLIGLIFLIMIDKAKDISLKVYYAILFLLISTIFFANYSPDTAISISYFTHSIYSSRQSLSE